MNIIQEELLLAKEKMLEEIVFNNTTLVKISRDNVAIVEAMIRTDSNYIKSSNKFASPKINTKGKETYGGSSAYWISKLKEYFETNNTDNTYYKELISGIVASVDRENSTHLNADGCGRNDIISRLCNFDKIEFLKCLKDPTYNNMKLIKEITRRTSANKKARTNPSFASKFCHYTCFYLFENTEYQDNYPIYDNILKTVLPLYLKYFNINKAYNMNDYEDYMNAVDDVRSASGIRISRNGFDHLLWYYHKGKI